MINNLSKQARSVMEELKEKAKLKPGDIVVVGCSTSEIIGSKIGSNSSPEVAKTVFEALYEYAKEQNINLAFQCCEHLNRAIVVEKMLSHGRKRLMLFRSQRQEVQWQHRLMSISKIL